MSRIAVIGAGLAGSMCARTLRAAGVDVVVVDKARGPGGRCSTRRARTDAGEVSFDHGAQYFTIRNPRHAALLDDWIRSGAAAPWEAFIGTLERGALGPEGRARDGSATAPHAEASTPTRYVGTPAMNAIVKALQPDLGVEFDCRIGTVEAEGVRWRLRPAADDSVQSDERAHTARSAVFDGTFDAVVLTAPPAQSAALLRGVEPRLAEAASKARLAPCWAAMVLFAGPVRFAGPHAAEPKAEHAESIGGMFVRDSPISWAANQCTKPGRAAAGFSGDLEHWVLHASPEWSDAHLEDDPAKVGSLLIEAFAEATGQALPRILHLATHRWRYASVEVPGARPFLWSPRGLGLCGDWCAGGRVEGALTSGRVLAERLLTVFG